MLSPKHCAYPLCGRLYYPKTARSSYCSNPCRSKASMRKRGTRYTQAPPQDALFKKGLSPLSFSQQANWQLLVHNPSLLKEINQRKAQLEKLVSAQQQTQANREDLRRQQQELQAAIQARQANLPTAPGHSFGKQALDQWDQDGASAKSPFDRMMRSLHALAGAAVDVGGILDQHQTNLEVIEDLKKQGQELEKIHLEIIRLERLFQQQEQQITALHFQLNTTIQTLNVPPRSVAKPVAGSPSRSGLPSTIITHNAEATPAPKFVIPSPRHVSARAFDKQQFAESLRLAGALGDFLGDLEREMLAITLTGSPGQGKTHFCLELIRYFCQLKLQVVFWSFEEGLSKKLKRKLRLYRLNNHKRLTLSEGGSLEDLKADAQAFDVVVIDSWTALRLPGKVFADLTRQFPQTIFVVIFRQTTGKQMRGGNEPAYDATINIHVDKGVAYNQKNRCGGKGTFAIFENV